MSFPPQVEKQLVLQFSAEKYLEILALYPVKVAIFM